MGLLGYIGLVKAQVGKLFIQLLSSLNLVDGVPVGMIDEIDGNDTLFKQSNCFRNDNIGYPMLDTGVQITNAAGSTGKLSCICEVDVVGANNFNNLNFGGNPLSSFNRLYITNGGTTVAGFGWFVGGLGATVEEDEFKTIFDSSDKIYIEWEKLTGNGHYRCYVKSLTTGLEHETTRTDIYVGNNDALQPFNSLIGRVAGGINGARYYNYKITAPDGKNYHWPLSESVENATTHIIIEVINGNNATLTSGSLNNGGTQDRYHYLQNGYTVSDGVNYYYDQALTKSIPNGWLIPAHATQSGKCAAYTTGGVLADLTVIQDGKKWLNSGNKHEWPDVQALKDADVDNVLYEIGGTPKQVSFSELENAISNNPSVYGGEVVAGESIKNISLK